MARARQTVERRQLGLTLRRLRENAGWTQQAAAEAIGRVRSRIVELEDGKGTLSQQDLAQLLDAYQVAGVQRDNVLALGAQARKRLRRGPHTDLLPDSFQRFADLEASATEIRNFESGMVPGLLQSPGYVRSIIEDGDGIWWESDAELTERIAFRLDRQTQVWNSGHLKVATFVVAEEALRTSFGDPDTMREQLRHLLDLDKSQSVLTVQVLPQGIASNPARGGSFVVFGFDHAPAVGVTKAVFGPELLFDHPTDVAALTRAFARLSELAMTPKESRAVISKIMRAI